MSFENLPLYKIWFYVKHLPEIFQKLLDYYTLKFLDENIDKRKKICTNMHHMNEGGNICIEGTYAHVKIAKC